MRDLVEDLTRRAPESLEAALLLRDLWEVLRITEYRQSENPSPLAQTLLRLVERIEESPFAGEEVLF